MDLNQEQFERLSTSNQADKKSQKSRHEELQSKWEILHKKHKVDEPVSQFPLVQFKPPADFPD